MHSAGTQGSYSFMNMTEVNTRPLHWFTVIAVHHAMAATVRSTPVPLAFRKTIEIFKRRRGTIWAVSMDTLNF